MKRRIALLAIASCLTSIGLTGCAIKSRPFSYFKKAPLAMGAATDVQIPGYELKCIIGETYSYVIFSEVVDALKFSRQRISAQWNEMPAIPAKFIRASFPGLVIGIVLFQATLSAVVRNLREQGFLVLNDHPGLFEIWSLCSGGDIEPRQLSYNKNGVSVTLKR